MSFTPASIKPGAKGFGFLQVAETRGRFPVHLPLHVVRGAHAGPTLAIFAGASGLEVEPALALPSFINALDPSKLRGALFLVPMLNTSGLEFEREASAWDGKRLNQLGRGRPDGTVSEQLLDGFYRTLVEPADALLELRTGALTSYHRFAAVFGQTEAPVAFERSCELAASLGLTDVVVNFPTEPSLAFAAAQAGQAVAIAAIGGGPGFRDRRHEDGDRARRAARNALIALGMLDGAIEQPNGAPRRLLVHTWFTQGQERGLTLITAERGAMVQAGDKVGHVLHPFTGDIVHEFVAPRAGVVVHLGAAWPLMPEGTPLAAIADLAPC